VSISKLGIRKEISSAKKEKIMFTTGEIIGKKYKVQGLCNDSGGMGAILFVSNINDDNRSLRPSACALGFYFKHSFSSYL